MHTTDQLVTDVMLLEQLFPAEARPTTRWLRYQRARRVIPYYKLSKGVVRFSVPEVREVLRKRMLIEARAA